MQFISFVPTLFAWWYGRGLTRLFQFLGALFSYTANLFSIKSLLKTLFSPWKKMVGERQKGIEGLKLWLLDNFVSRTVGFVVRVMMIIFCLISILLYGIFAIVAIGFWLLMPGVILGAFFFLFIGY